MKCILDILSVPTYDIIENRYRHGGPGFYAFYSLHATGLPTTINIPVDIDVPEGYLLLTPHISPADCTTIFHIEEDTTTSTRSLTLKEKCTLRDFFPRGDILLFSLVMWDISSYNIAKILPQYKFSVVDVQGYSRVYDGTRVVNRPEILTATLTTFLPKHTNTIIKMSIEDIQGIRDEIRAIEKITGSAILTFGPKGLIYKNTTRTIVVKPPRILRVDTTGAGDMLSTLILYSLCMKQPIEEALCRAVSSIVCILQERDKRGFYSIPRGICSRYYHNPECKIKNLTLSNNLLNIIPLHISN